MNSATGPDTSQLFNVEEQRRHVPYISVLYDVVSFLWGFRLYDIFKNKKS
jgi:hypothetical protein